MKIKKNPILWLGILLANLCFFASVFGQGWEWQNPLPQGNFLRSMEAVDANHVWYGTSAGIVLHSSDGGNTWELQQTPSTAFIKGIDFVDTQFGWAVGTEEERDINPVVLHTTDGGLTWTRQSLPEGYNALLSLAAVQFLDRQRGWVVGDFGLAFYTEDSGTTWQKHQIQASDGFFRNLFDVSVIDSQRVWVAGEYSLAHTEDGGQTWHTDTTAVGHQVFDEVFFVDAIHGWLVTDVGELLKTIDGGGGWNSGKGNLSEEIGHVFFLTPDCGWVGASTGIYWTTDGGRNWEKIFDDPVVGNFVFTDGSSGWSNTRMDIFRTTDGGRKWQELSSAVTKNSLQAVDFVDSETGWVVGSRGTILATKDGGQQWTRQESGVKTRLNDVMFLDRQLGWTVGFTGTVLRTRDAGESWQLLQQIPGRNPHRAVVFVDSLVGWVVGGDVLEPGWIRHTMDGGKTWIEQTPGTIPRMFDVYFLDKNTGWVVGESGQIWFTKDGGTNWEQQDSGVGANLTVVEFTSPVNGWISIGGSYLLHTINGGQNWDIVNINGFKGALGDISFVDDKHGWIAGGLGVIFFTQDGGETWNRQFGGTTMTFHSVDFVDLKNGWAVGNLGMILHTSTGGVTSVQSSPAFHPTFSKFQLYPNYPNPFNPETRIRFEIKKSLVQVSLIIYDVLGRKILELLNERLVEGYYEMLWDGTNDKNIPSPSGVYFFQLKVDGQSQTRKMLLLR